jgi:hypothetical protein
MRGIRFYTDKVFSVLAIGLLAVYLSYSLTAFVQRLADPPRDMVELSGLQLETGIVGLAIGAALAGLIAARHNRFGGRDLLASAARPAVSRVVTQFAAVAAPVLVGWLIFVVVTVVSNDVSGKFAPGILAIGVGALALAACVALGQIIGIWLPPVFAVPAAFVGAYSYAAVCAIFGDDYWWQWLGPAFGDSMTPSPKVLWLVGEYFWFGGVTLLLLTANARLVSSPRYTPRILLTVASGTALIGIVLLAINGPDASPDI